MITDILSEAQDKMGKAIEALRRDLATVRTGRASPALVEHIKVEYYGTQTLLYQIAGISVPEARLLVIQPWDRGALSAIEKALLKSDLGLHPTSDGQMIRLVIPELTEERRKELVRVVRKRAEEGRVSLRNVRREALESLRELERGRGISEDEGKRAREQLQKLTDGFVEEIDSIGRAKEAELLEV